MNPDIAICHRNQADCAAYLVSNGPDKAGAWAGLCDWLVEECLIETEQRNERTTTGD